MSQLQLADKRERSDGPTNFVANWDTWLRLDFSEATNAKSNSITGITYRTFYKLGVWNVDWHRGHFLRLMKSWTSPVCYWTKYYLTEWDRPPEWVLSVIIIKMLAIFAGVYIVFFILNTRCDNNEPALWWSMLSLTFMCHFNRSPRPKTASSFGNSRWWLLTKGLLWSFTWLACRVSRVCLSYIFTVWQFAEVVSRRVMSGIEVIEFQCLRPALHHTKYQHRQWTWFPDILDHRP